MNKETKIHRQMGPVVLIVAPTRELSIQIFNLFNKLNKVCVHIVAGLLIGGECVKSEKEKIRKGINVVIGTPGKILYHMKNTKGLQMTGIESVVYEEADQILQLGFERDLGEILDMLNI